MLNYYFINIGNNNWIEGEAKLQKKLAALLLIASNSFYFIVWGNIQLLY